VKNLQVLRVDQERNLVAVKGAVPGPRGGLVLLKKLGQQ
jgi:large subunit ribosomal protein L3